MLSSGYVTIFSRKSTLSRKNNEKLDSVSYTSVVLVVMSEDCFCLSRSAITESLKEVLLRRNFDFFFFLLSVFVEGQ